MTIGSLLRRRLFFGVTSAHESSPAGCENALASLSSSSCSLSARAASSSVDATAGGIGAEEASTFAGSVSRSDPFSLTFPFFFFFLAFPFFFALLSIALTVESDATGAGAASSFGATLALLSVLFFRRSTDTPYCRRRLVHLGLRGRSFLCSARIQYLVRPSAIHLPLHHHSIARLDRSFSTVGGSNSQEIDSAYPFHQLHSHLCLTSAAGLQSFSSSLMSLFS